jgi:hypothetical protein
MSPVRLIRKKSNIIIDGYFEIPPNEKDAFYALNLLRGDKELFIELLN